MVVPMVDGQGATRGNGGAVLRGPRLDGDCGPSTTYCRVGPEWFPVRARPRGRARSRLEARMRAARVRCAAFAPGFTREGIGLLRFVPAVTLRAQLASLRNVSQPIVAWRGWSARPLSSSMTPKAKAQPRARIHVASLTSAHTSITSARAARDSKSPRSTRDPSRDRPPRGRSSRSRRPGARSRRARCARAGRREAGGCRLVDRDGEGLFPEAAKRRREGIGGGGDAGRGPRPSRVASGTPRTGLRGAPGGAGRLSAVRNRPNARASPASGGARSAHSPSIHGTTLHGHG